MINEKETGDLIEDILDLIMSDAHTARWADLARSGKDPRPIDRYYRAAMRPKLWSVLESPKVNRLKLEFRAGECPFKVGDRIPSGTRDHKGRMFYGARMFAESVSDDPGPVQVIAKCR